MRLILLSIFILTAGVFFGQCPSGPSAGCDGSGASLDLYWVGTDMDGNGNWNSPCSWRVGSVAGVEPCQAPRSHDNVFFEAAGFTGFSAPVITLNTQARCNDLFFNPDVDFMGFPLDFNLQNPGFLEVYGDFTLQAGVAWNVVGGNNSGPELFFKATTPGHTIKTAGKTLGAVQIDGIGGEWKLQENFACGSFRFVFGDFSTSDGVIDHDMNILTFDSHLSTGASSTNRILNFNSSTITVTGTGGNDRYPYNTTNSPNTTWESRDNTQGTHINFDAGTSKIILTTASPFVRLGGLNFNVIQHTGTGRLYDHFGNTPCNIDTLETNGYLYFHHEHIFNVLKINSVGLEHNFFYHQKINTDLIATGDVCSPTVFNSDNNRILTMPSVVTADPMNGFLISNLRCADGTAGHTVNGFGSGTTTGWNILLPLARDLYWVGNTNTNWSEPTNWSTSPSGTPLLTAADCPPTQTDNVFFIPALANGDVVKIDAEAYCNNQTWTITAATTFSGNQKMNIYGNLQLDADINMTSTSQFSFYGTNSNTVLSAGITLPSTSYFEQFSDYTLLDNLSFVGVYLYDQDSFNSGGFDMTGSIMYFRSGTQDFSGSTITLSGTTPWSSNGNQGNTTYDANSHVIFTNGSATTTISGWGPNLKFPSFTLQSASTRLVLNAHMGSSANNTIFEGDVTLNGSLRYYGEYGFAITPSNMGQMQISGDLTLGAGGVYEFGVDTPIAVGGNFTANGSCVSPVTIQGIAGNSFDINVTGTSTLDYCNIANLHSGSAMTATNSLDAGDNVNVTFPGGANTTYYWRARAGSCGTTCDYNGDWNSTLGYWTTNPASIEGVAGCIPTSADDVVFDNMSFSGTQSNISIPVTVSCHNITITATNAKWTGTGNLKVTGSVSSDGTLLNNGFTGTLDFISNDATGETIDFGGTTLGCDVNFSNVLGSWTNVNSPFITNKSIYLNSGVWNTNDQDITMKWFNSSNSNTRTLDLGASDFNITGNGNFIAQNSAANIYTWNSKVTTNFTFIKGTSNINISSVSEPVFYSNSLDLHHLNFTSTSSISTTSPVVDAVSLTTEYMKFDCSARIYGSHAYDTLEFSAGNVYKIQGSTTQTLNAPDGILIATGSAGDEIAIKSISTGTPSTFHKLNTGGAMTSFCFDYISVEDNMASSDDPLFVFFTGVNSNDISATGIWDFNRALFFTPAIDAAADLNVCPGTIGDITWAITGSGPYTLQYSVGGGATTTVTLPNGTTSYTVPGVSHYADTDYDVVVFTGDNCGVNTAGTMTDPVQNYNVPDPTPISVNGDQGSCFLANENQFVHIYSSGGTQRPIASVSDAAAGSGLGNVVIDVAIDATVQAHTMNWGTHTMPYMQRHFGINPDNAQQSNIRLYFTQAELDALAVAYGSPVGLGDLVVTKFDNDDMDFTGANSLLLPINTGTIPGGITTSTNVLFIEITVSSYSHFLIHPVTNGPLPVKLLSFEADLVGSHVETKWNVATEFDVEAYEVLKSRDGNEWITVGRHRALGKSGEVAYTMYDEKPFQGTSFYRLKEIGFNGDITLHDPKEVAYNADQLVSVYPNPNNGSFALNYSAISHKELDVKMFNNLGDIVYSKSHGVSEGSNLIDIQASVAAGIYTIQVSYQDASMMLRQQVVIE